MVQRVEEKRGKVRKWVDVPLQVPGDERLCLSNGWLDCFKARNSLKDIKRHSKAASASIDTMEQERNRIQELIKKYGYELYDIFNMDETGLFYAYIPISYFSGSTSDSNP
jgi:hypothetical protein